MRTGGIEPPTSPWQGDILPLNYVRALSSFFVYKKVFIFIFINSNLFNKICQL